MDLIRITPDTERARSILKMTSLIQGRINKESKEDRIKIAALIIADYYEIIKELITAVLLIDGYKTLSHKTLVDYLKEKYSDSFNAQKLSLINDLRVLRNKVTYEGFFTDPSYLRRNENNFKEIISLLRHSIKSRLGYK